MSPGLALRRDTLFHWLASWPGDPQQGSNFIKCKTDVDEQDSGEDQYLATRRLPKDLEDNLHQVLEAIGRVEHGVTSSKNVSARGGSLYTGGRGKGKQPAGSTEQNSEGEDDSANSNGSSGDGGDGGDGPGGNRPEMENATVAISRPDHLDQPFDSRSFLKYHINKEHPTFKSRPYSRMDLPHCRANAKDDSCCHEQKQHSAVFRPTYYCPVPGCDRSIGSQSRTMQPEREFDLELSTKYIVDRHTQFNNNNCNCVICQTSSTLEFWDFDALPTRLQIQSALKEILSKENPTCPKCNNETLEQTQQQAPSTQNIHQPQVDPNWPFPAQTSHNNAAPLENEIEISQPASSTQTIQQAQVDENWPFPAQTSHANTDPQAPQANEIGMAL